MSVKNFDEYSAHEALDRAHLVASLFSDFVADHPFVNSNPNLRVRAEALATELAEFYQLIGQVRFPDAVLTPTALAKELGIDPKTLRQFLRDSFPRGGSQHGSRWRLEQEHIIAARRRWTR